MLTRLPRFRRPWLVVAVLIVLALIAFEVVRLVTAQLAVDRAAHEAARYAVTGLYDKKQQPQNSTYTPSAR